MTIDDTARGNPGWSTLLARPRVVLVLPYGPCPNNLGFGAHKGTKETIYLGTTKMILANYLGMTRSRKLLVSFSLFTAKSGVRSLRYRIRKGTNENQK